MKNVFPLLKANWDLSIRLNLLLAIAYLLFVPIIRGIANLDAVHSAECLEQAVAFIGVFLFVPLTGPEQSKDVQEVVFSKKKSYVTVLLMRLVIAICSLIVLILIFASAMTLLSCSFPFYKYVFGTLASALVLGSCGFLTAALSNSMIAGYLTSAGYFMLNMLGGIETSSKLSLFSMSDGIFDVKYWLTAIGCLCILLVMLYEKLHKR